MKVFVFETSETTGKLRVDLENRDSLTPRGSWETIQEASLLNYSKLDRKEMSVMFKIDDVPRRDCFEDYNFLDMKAVESLKKHGWKFDRIDNFCGDQRGHEVPVYTHPTRKGEVRRSCCGPKYSFEKTDYVRFEAALHNQYVCSRNNGGCTENFFGNVDCGSGNPEFCQHRTLSGTMVSS